MKKLLLIVLVSLALPTQAAIQTIDPVTGKLTGATGVDVGGSLYDVKFVDGSCISLFSGCTSAANFTFQSGSAAIAASTALINQVFLDTAAGAFDSNPGLTAGIGDALGTPTAPGDILIPWDVPAAYESVPPDLRIFMARNTFGTDETINAAEFFCCDGFRAFDTGSSPQLVYAVWTSSTVSAAPEPEIYAMMLTGFGVLGWVARRKKSLEHVVSQA